MKDCARPDVRDRLSCLLDGELDPLQVAGVLEHFPSCPSCKQVWEDLGSLREQFRRAGRTVPPAPAWESIEARLVPRAPVVARPQRSWWTRPLVPAAAGLLIAVFAGSFVLTRSLLAPERPAPGVVETPFNQVLDLYVRQDRHWVSSTFARHLTACGARAASREQLAESVAFKPLVPQRLPGGFDLDAGYLLATRCCDGIHLRYLKGSQVVALFQQAPGHPTEWRGGGFHDTTIAGVPCRRARVGDVELVQVELVGRNITLVARSGSVEVEDMVRFLGTGAQM